MPLWLYHLGKGFHGGTECAVKHIPSTRRGLGKGPERAPGGEQSWGHDRQRQLHKLRTVCGRRKQQEASVSAHAVPRVGSTPVIPGLRFSSSPNPCSQNRLGRRHVAYGLHHITRVASDLLGVASARHCSSCFHCFLPDPSELSEGGMMTLVLKMRNVSPREVE